MTFFTKVRQDGVVFIFSHESNILRSFPELAKPERIPTHKFFSRMARARLLAIKENMPFSIKQYESRKKINIKK